MKFSLKHVLPHAPARAWTGLFSKAYMEASQSRSAISTELLLEEEEGERRIRRSRVTSTRNLPRPIAKVLGDSQLSYELIETYEDSQQSMRWRVVPSRLSDKIRASGTYRIGPGPDADRCERTITGEVTVSIRLVGKKIEEYIGQELEAGYERSTAFACRWLEEHG